MRARTFLITGVIGLLLFVTTRAEPIRYRGDYTYGHEVNIFCPAINSQCYWLSGDTPTEVRDSLRSLAAENTSKPYQANCIVIEAEIDRGTERDGFAADYDGLITVMKLFGRCDETRVVTQGDLQHHRWILESINGEALDADAMDGKIPDLDFGEQMHVSGNSGCNRISGRASLHDTFIRFEEMVSTLMSCGPVQDDIEATIQMLLASKKIEIQIHDNYLILEGESVSLRYRLQDWVD
jgi:heat shock protein HslJ